MDNLCSSQVLFTLLSQAKTNAVGTLHQNQEDVPKALGQKKLNKGESVISILETKFENKKCMIILSICNDSVGITHWEKSVYQRWSVRR